MRFIMPIPSLRLSALMIVLFTACLMATGFYMEHVMGLKPCLLCMTQRVCISAAGVIAFIALLHNPSGWGWRIYSALIGLTAIAGAALAGRQIWLQSLPKDQVPACAPPLDYMLEVFPLAQTIQMMLQGDGDCAEISWQFLTLSIPQWTLLGFIFIFIIAVRLFFRKKAKAF